MFRREVLKSFLLFGLMTGGLYFVDLFLSATLDDYTLAEWAIVRSVVLFGSITVVLGIDQVLIRQPDQQQRIFLPLLIQISILSAPFLAIPIFGKSTASAAPIYIAIVALGFSITVAGRQRARYRISAALVSVHGWKLLFGLTVIVAWNLGYLTYIRLEYLLATSCVLVASYGAHRELSSRTGHDHPKPAFSALRRMYPLGLRFWGFSLVTSATSYLDQILLHLDQERTASGLYFAYCSAFLPLSSFATGFAANTIGPYFRREGERIRTRLRLLTGLFVAATILVAFGTLGAGLLLGRMIGRFDGDGIVWWLALSLTAIGVLRWIYIIPSAVLGIFGTKEELDRMLVTNACSIAAMIITYAGMRWAGVGGIQSIVAAMGMNTLIRAGVGVTLSVRLLVQPRRSLEVLS